MLYLRVKRQEIRYRIALESLSDFEALVANDWGGSKSFNHISLSLKIYICFGERTERLFNSKRNTLSNSRMFGYIFAKSFKHINK